MVSTDIDDLFEVQCEVVEVASHWRELGLALKLRPHVLEEIKANEQDVRSRQTQVLTKWLEQCYNTGRFGPPSWRLLVDAVAHPVGASNPALAQKIADRHNGTYQLMSVSL